MRLKLFGCDFELDFLFVVILSVAALTENRDFIFILLFSMLHEAGHFVCLLICGGKPSKLVLSYYGFALKYNCELARYKEALVISAGCVVNLLLFFVFRDRYNPVLFVLNALPIYPLDGGRLVMLYSPRLARITSVLFTILVIALAIYILVVYNSFSLILIAVYLAAYCFNY